METKLKRSPIDRRSGDDRRKAYDMNYFLSGGVERRNWKEERSRDERRRDCVRVSDFVSVC